MAARRKILVATPIRGGASSNYFESIMAIMKLKLPDIELEHCVLEGPSVNFARNEIAHYAIAIKARDLLFMDEDMGVTTDHFKRIISHDLDIVAGLYCKRRPGQPFWIMNDKPGCEPDPVTGLCETNDMPTGFMKIRVDTVFPAMMEKFPEREFFNKPESGKPVTAYEFFPMGVFGPRSPYERLKKIKALLASRPYLAADKDLLDLIRIAAEETHEPGVLRGEDYAFCELARECGFKIYADFGMPIIPHLGKVAFPITPDMVGLDPTAALKAAGEKV